MKGQGFALVEQVQSDIQTLLLHATGTHAVKLKTYIVEDNATIRENLIATLEELVGIESIGTSETEIDGKTWLTDTDTASIWDLAIVDLFLKQGSGLGVVAACRGRSPLQKVVVLTNYATADVRARCAQLGVDAVYDKSNEIDALIAFCLQQCTTLSAAPKVLPELN